MSSGSVRPSAGLAPAITVVVPARNAAATIGRALTAVGAQELDADYEVVVVDNGSDDDTGAVAARALPEARVIRKEPGGVGSARNRGVAEARTDRIAFLDADCYPEANWLGEGLACLERADLVQGAVAPDPLAKRAPFDRTVGVDHETGLYETANLFVRRDTFERVGGFDDWVIPDIEAPFGEDAWFGWQARRLGARTAFCSGARVHHEVFPRSATDYAAERRRATYFPDLVERVPELRGSFLWNRWFLTGRTAAFDAMVLALVAGLVTRSPLPLVVAVPYLATAGCAAARWRRLAPRALAGEIWADAVTFVALVRGSARARTIVV